MVSLEARCTEEQSSRGSSTVCTDNAMILEEDIAPRWIVLSFASGKKLRYRRLPLRSPEREGFASSFLEENFAMSRVIVLMTMWAEQLDHDGGDRSGEEVERARRRKGVN